MRLGHEACFGCSLCLLACPVWQATRDVRLTPRGRAKALQHGATLEELVDSIDSCTLCGSCEPACPQEMALPAMVMDMRAELGRRYPDRIAPGQEPSTRQGAQPGSSTAAAVLIPGRALCADESLTERILRLLAPPGRVSLAADGGTDIVRSLESGASISEERIERFLAPLRRAKRLVVGDGLLFRALRDWLPGARPRSLGEALSFVPAVRKALRSEDMYVIESRAYHADRERLVKYYDALRASFGGHMNLDLQRLAIPTTAGGLPAALGRNRVDVLAQARWILEGRTFSRIVVESPDDIAAFAAVSDKPVVHLAQLA